MVPRTGAIKVFATNPSFNPNLKPHPNALAASEAASAAGLTGPEVDRVTDSQYFPGSIEKVVTAIAAIDTGKDTPSTYINGDSPQTFEGIPLANDGKTSYGNITLTQALTESVNTAFANVAQGVGGALLGRYMDRLGYYRDPPIDLPAGELTPSGVFNEAGTKLIPPSEGDVPLIGIGEGHLVVTPLQMVEVAAAVANHGVLMTPHLTNYWTNADGAIVGHVEPTVFSTVMKPSTASAVGVMMESVVSDGTAQAALQGFQYQVAGKTGTAQDCDTCTTSQVWFIAYAPAADPKIAIAVTLEKATGFGGTVAAPIARQVIQSILGKTG
jgi:peptidoglycan glycosyltransferase